MTIEKVLPESWLKLPLGELCDLVIGKTPSRKRNDYWIHGVFPWATIGDMGGPILSKTQEEITELAAIETKIPLISSGTILLSFKLSLGKVAIAGIDLYTNEAIMAIIPKDRNIILNEYLYFVLQSLDIRGKARDAVKGKTVNKKILKNMIIARPPCLVQERIVEILQKADEIRQKRQMALNVAEAILPSSFISMFGDPKENVKDFPVSPLSEIADIKSGVTKGKKFNGKKTIMFPYIRVANVQDGFLELSEIKTIEILPKDVENYHLEYGDILMTEGGDPDKLGRGCIWRNQIKGIIHQNHIFRVRVDRSHLAPEYLAALLRTQYAKQYFLSCAKRSSNLASVNSTQVKAFPVPLPPIMMQKKFVSAVDQWDQTIERLAGALRESERIFQSLLSKAFSGELTREWEIANMENMQAANKMMDK